MSGPEKEKLTKMQCHFFSRHLSPLSVPPGKPSNRHLSAQFSCVRERKAFSTHSLKEWDDSKVEHGAKLRGDGFDTQSIFEEPIFEKTKNKNETIAS